MVFDARNPRCGFSSNGDIITVLCGSSSSSSSEGQCIMIPKTMATRPASLLIHSDGFLQKKKERLAAGCSRSYGLSQLTCKVLTDVTNLNLQIVESNKGRFQITYNNNVCFRHWGSVHV